jgi:hypothetical protein
MDFLQPLLAAVIASLLTYVLAIRQFRSERNFEIQVKAFFELFAALKLVRVFMMDRDKVEPRTYGSPEFRDIFNRLNHAMEHDRPFLPRRSTDPGATLVNLLSVAVKDDETVGNGTGFEFRMVCLIDEYLEEIAMDLKLSYGKSLYAGI